MLRDVRAHNLTRVEYNSDTGLECPPDMGENITDNSDKRLEGSPGTDDGNMGIPLFFKDPGITNS